MNEGLRYEREGRVGRITLDRAEKRNALDADLLMALGDRLRQIGSDREIRVVTLTGAGKDFCAGLDLGALRRLSKATVVENLEDVQLLAGVLRQLRSLRQPVIALVRGRALAGGCGLATGCDLVLAAESASFGYTEVRIGFVPAMVMAILRRNVSEKRAFELAIGGEILPAREAERLGLINRVFPDVSFEDEAEEFVQRVAGSSASAVSLTKRLLYQQDAMTFDAAVAAGADVNVLARMTEDTRAGVESFLDQRGRGGSG